AKQDRWGRSIPTAGLPVHQRPTAACPRPRERMRPVLRRGTPKCLAQSSTLRDRTPARRVEASEAAPSIRASDTPEDRARAQVRSTAGRAPKIRAGTPNRARARTKPTKADAAARRTIPRTTVRVAIARARGTETTRTTGVTGARRTTATTVAVRRA